MTTDLRDILPNASAETIRRNPALFGAVRSEAPAPYTTSREIRERVRFEQERDLQAECERWLESAGYHRRTSTNIQHRTGGRWYIHLPKSKGNPIVMDLLILDSIRNRHIEIELKTRSGRLSPDQKHLVTRGEAVLCRGIEEFVAAVRFWESANAEVDRDE